VLLDLLDDALDEREALKDRGHLQHVSKDAKLAVAAAAAAAAAAPTLALTLASWRGSFM
jgi:hypothetical protein